MSRPYFRANARALLRRAPVLFPLALAACSAPSPTQDITNVDAAADGAAADVPRDTAPAPLPVLGNGRHTSASVRIRIIATEADQLSVPRDLAFNSDEPTQLWIANNQSSSITILRDVGLPTQNARTRRGPGNTHFLSRPSALAFGAPGTLGTAQEQDAITQPTTPGSFMGPTLWDSTYEFFDGGLASHLDMLHNSPNSVGIAWERDNVYWIVDGLHGSLTQYDFREPHELGGADHSDGIVLRYAAGMIGYVRGVSSHAEFDPMTQRVFVADTGNNRIAVLDPAGATQGARISPNFDGTNQRMMTGGTLETFVDGAAFEMQAPSGLALVNDLFYVTDNTTSRVFAFDRMGRLIDWLDLSDRVQTGALMGIALSADGRVYLTDAADNRVIEVSPAM